MKILLLKQHIANPNPTRAQPVTRLKVFKKGGQHEFTGKAYNNRVMCIWLAWCLKDFAQKKPNPSDRATMTCTAMNLGTKLTCHPSNYFFGAQMMHIPYTGGSS